QFQLAKQSAEGSSAFARLSGRFPLCGRGDVNLYALFAEHFAKVINARGRSGVIVPTGIATDDSTKFFFGWLAQENRLASLFDFENREAIFKSVHRSYKFCLLTIGSDIPLAKLTFFATQPHQLADARRCFSLTGEEFARINPNTLTCPVFRSQKDAELTKKIYRAAPVLIRESSENSGEINPWGIKFARLFDMSTDSDLFLNHEQSKTFPQGTLPLYEAKMVHHYDHRWATYENDGETSRDCNLLEKQNPAYQSLPRYWVPENEVTLRTTKAPKAVLDAAKKNDELSLTDSLKQWLAGYLIETTGISSSKDLIEKLLGQTIQQTGGDLFSNDISPLCQQAQAMQQTYPLTGVEADQLATVLEKQHDLWSSLWPLLEARRPKYLLGWRDICRATDERTVIAGVIPLCGVGNNMPVMLNNAGLDPQLWACLLGNLISLPFDFVARHKVGGTHLNFFIIKQLPVLGPTQYDKPAIDFIVPRVLELTYTANDLQPFAEDLGYHGDTFPFNPERRHQLKCELDAYYAKLYCLTRDEFRYIFDPTDVMGEDYPSETFRVLKNKELREFDEFRTQRLVLEAWDKLEAGDLK
ncbi:MAG: hypothetical protein KDI30_03230, partial [Pseudomonadales bacterium]|nr:hypothetical protein [Pseudomonadales bacterium]